MPLANLLQELGVKATADDVFQAIHQTLENPGVTLSDLTEAIAARIYRGPTRVISDGANQFWASAARRIIELLLAERVLAVQGRIVGATDRFPSVAGSPIMAKNR